MGINLELSVLLLISVLGQSFFGRFELETPPWRKALKWLLIIGVTLGIYRYSGHWALLLPLAMAAVGLTFHFVWCRRNGINPFRATPTRKYYQLRGWQWPLENN